MITSVTAATDSATGAASMKQATGMNSDDFLKLFVAQLQNQDPLNPQDGTQFIAQLAQLSQVEQAYNTNTNLQQMMNLQGSGNVMSSVSFIGKDVVAVGDQLNVKGGTATPLNYQLGSAANSVVLQVVNSTGSVVRSLTLGPTAAGTGQVAWDGKDASGLPVPDGTYQLKVAATDTSGSQVSASPLMTGIVDGVDMNGTSPVLTMGGLSVDLANVLQVKGG